MDVSLKLVWSSRHITGTRRRASLGQRIHVTDAKASARAGSLCEQSSFDAIPSALSATVSLCDPYMLRRPRQPG
jgi:hypothetical protein